MAREKSSTRPETSRFWRRNCSRSTFVSRALAVPRGSKTVILTGTRTLSSTCCDAGARVKRLVVVRSTRACAGTGRRLRPSATARAAAGGARARSRPTSRSRPTWAAVASTRQAADAEAK